jgi:hypothetical protein
MVCYRSSLSSFIRIPIYVHTVHGSGALSCHYRKRTLKRQMTPEAVERRRKSGLSKLDDYNCPFKLAYSKLRFAKNQNSRKWKPRIFHIGTFTKETNLPTLRHLVIYPFDFFLPLTPLSMSLTFSRLSTSSIVPIGLVLFAP